MCKLLTEPRVIKEITAPKKKTRVKKNPSEGVEVTYTVITEGKSNAVTELFKLYKESPYKARVKFFNETKKYTTDRTCIFQKGSDDFEICTFRNTFGISITSRIYSSQKKLYSISYKNGKLWYIKNPIKGARQITPLTYGGLLEYIGYAESIYNHVGNHNISKSKIFEFMVSRFPWIKMLSEHRVSMGVNLNVVKAKGLTSEKDINRHVLGVPNNIALMVIESGVMNNVQSVFGGQSRIKGWKECLRYMDGIQNLSVEFLRSEYFVDTIKMAKVLGKKVNCRWNLKRLKEEHDKWSREIANIILDCEEEYALKIKDIYKQFAEYSKYQMLLTNKEMLIEGIMQDHCVGTYIERVDRGDCAIYHVEGYTLQVGVGEFLVSKPNERVIRGFNKDMSNLNTFNKLYNMQFRGKHNNTPPIELTKKVNEMLEKFNEEVMSKEVIKTDSNAKKVLFDEWPNDEVDLEIYRPRRVKNLYGIEDENLPF